MPNGVSCTVSNCSFWKEGNGCNAKEITIEIDQHSSHSYHEEFAGDELGLFHEDQAEQSSATCCLTFNPKE
ncbi:DUF1540 domain-containing protein [Paenibacillus sp. YIM B09110]|uniref:DUF1540 domain-containing protein n=1 Tax=unclassified Paenibacillus TaxID=185978 RepID=UPI00301D2866